MDVLQLRSSTHQQLLVQLAHWLSRTMQYSPGHPSSRALAEKLHATLTEVLSWEPQVVLGVLKENVTIGDVASSHPAVRTRLAGHLHDRGVLALRFAHGVTIPDLEAFVELLLLPAQTIFDRGGLASLTTEAGIARIQVDELVYEVSEEQLESGRRRRRLRDFFAEALRHLLARRDLGVAVGDSIAEMLAHPEITATILEDRGAGIAEAAAGLALMVRQEEQRTGEKLVPRLREILAMLPPLARDRVLMGFPPLVGEFRDALAWAMRGYHEAELARFCFPAFRARAQELELVLYAMSVLLPHDGTRLSTVRFVGLLLHDLPLDDSAADDALLALARPVDDFESFRNERRCLVEPALRALGARRLAQTAFAPTAVAVRASADEIADGSLAVAEVVRLIASTRQFERLARRLPEAAAGLAAGGEHAALLALVRSLLLVDQSEWRELALHIALAIAGAQAAELLDQLERVLPDADDVAVVELTTVARLVARGAPALVFDRVDATGDARVRQLLIEQLAHAGPAVLPLLRARLHAEAGPQVFHLLGLLPRLGGQPEDLLAVSRHADEAIRLEVVRVLRALPPDQKAMEIVLRYLADTSAEVRAGVRLLVRGDLLGPTAIPGVARLLDDKHQPEDVKARLVRALGQAPHDGAAQLLSQLLQRHALIELGEAVNLRELAAAALHASPAPRAARLFEEALASPSRRVRKAAERAAKGAS